MIPVFQRFSSPRHAHGQVSAMLIGTVMAAGATSRIAAC